MTDINKVREVFLRELEATGRDLDAALRAVVTTVRAERELSCEATRRPVEVSRQVVLRKYNRLAASRVIAEAAREWQVDPQHLGLAWAQRSTPHVRARWTAWAVLHAPPFGLSLPECAAALGCRHHTSVRDAILKIGGHPELLEAVARVRQRLGLWIAPVETNCQQPAMTEETNCGEQEVGFPAQRAPTVSTLASEETA